ncbi:hypothetical protein ACLIKE_07020 [Ferroplasma acidiphilum]|uniref:Uncharacterized protein n=1 Tax=Ferroplasma acidiphilum TaxID=74969 RepID=A0A7K4FPQ7_9ARCH|nr:hypothetical protein [Ferroplasma acidiphilum]NOL60249.1 hypothetical protein [Ferroplasma acidiphilum]
MTEQENADEKHTEGMLQVEKDVLIGEELQLSSVEKTKIERMGEEAELYIYYAKRTSDGQIVSFYGSSVLNEQYDLGYIKPDTFFVLDKLISRKSGNSYYKAIILHKAEVSK